MYADDCLIYSIGNLWENMVPRIQNGLNGFQLWCKNNCLKLNIRKSKSLVMDTSHKLSSIDMENRFKLDNVNLQHIKTYN